MRLIIFFAAISLVLLSGCNNPNPDINPDFDPDINSDLNLDVTSDESCYSQGEGEFDDDLPCCEGLTRIAAAITDNLTGEFLYMEHLGACGNCGDNICGAEENRCNCESDCN